MKLSVPRASRFGLAFWGVFAAIVAQGDEWKATDWPKADRLFHSDRRWLGADAAFSVPLGGDRVLWLFGDTFVGDGVVKRAKSAFIRNSIAVQHGLDPAHAAINFYWRASLQGPDSYFPGEGMTWLWPLHGLVRDGALTLFFMRVVKSDEGLGFNVTGTTVKRCANLAESPSAWKFKTANFGDAPAGLDLIYGVAVLVEDGFVLAYCVAVPGVHEAYLLRWRADKFDRGELGAPEWWDGTRYTPQRELSGAPAAVLPHAATEFSVHRLPDGRYVQVQSLGFGATDISLRFAPRPEGPWSAPEPAYRPRESRERDAFVYAGKAHPELKGAPLIVTYAANNLDPEKLLDSKTLYYPRFVRLEPKSSR